MADEVDVAQERMERIEALMPKPAPYVLPTGISGECSSCGYHSPRLIGDLCARCRDRVRIPGARR